jgi:hypothetical protein
VSQVKPSTEIAAHHLSGFTRPHTAARALRGGALLPLDPLRFSHPRHRFCRSESISHETDDSNSDRRTSVFVLTLTVDTVG